MSARIDPPSLFCFGYGYSAAVLAARLTRRGTRISGTVRTLVGGATPRAAGVETFLFDGRAPMAEGRAALAGATHLLSSVPPAPGIGDPVLIHHGADIARAGAALDLRASTGALRWVGYLSTTGVYGERGGAWVDEDATPSPIGERGQARLEAETAWLDLRRSTGVPVHIFRLAGIYGPGRSALDTVRNGSAKRIDKPGQVFSRIHVDDIAAVLEASIARPRPGAVYNVCDDEPTPPAEVIEFACGLLGVPPPPLVPYDEIAPTLSPMAKSFYAESKRVSNRLIKAELGVRLRYPDYRAGLRALFAEGA